MYLLSADRSIFIFLDPTIYDLTLIVFLMTLVVLAVFVVVIKYYK